MFAPFYVIANRVAKIEVLRYYEEREKAFANIFDLSRVQMS